jgi:hypothetical protein
MPTEVTPAKTEKAAPRFAMCRTIAPYMTAGKVTRALQCRKHVERLTTHRMLRDECARLLLALEVHALA